MCGVPPTVFLPPLKLLNECSHNEISQAIASLRHIYLPEVRGSSRRRRRQEPHSPHRPAVPDTTLHSQLTLKERAKSAELSAIRADPFERTFAIQWLTRFVSAFSQVVAADSSDVLEEAASLLAMCAGSAASGTVIRTFTFPFSSGASIGFGVRNGNEEISVVLHDAPLESSDFSSVGAQTWGGSCILAEMIAEHPRNFSICSREVVEGEASSLRLDADAPFRALELGAGTGLASLVLGKVLGRMRGVHHGGCQEGRSSRATQDVDTVIATDFHPSVLTNLRQNFAVNFPGESFRCETHVVSPEFLGVGPDMIVLPLDWSVIDGLAHPFSGATFALSRGAEGMGIHPVPTAGKDTTTVARHLDTFVAQARARALARTETSCAREPFSADKANVQSAAGPEPIAPELDVPFDLIIGADIIYEGSHARWVRSCVERFLRKPAGPCSHAGAAAPGDPVALPACPHPHWQRIPALFHLIIPLRHTHAVESRSVEEVFSRAADILSSRHSNNFGTADHAECLVEPVVLELAIISQEDIGCDAYSDREEGEVVYRYYRIGWV